MSRIPVLKNVIEVYQGETWSITVTLSGESAPANLDGYNIWMDWRDSQGGAAIQRFSLQQGNVVVTPNQPQAQFVLTQQETRALPVGNFPLDCFFETPQGSFALTFAGYVEILPRVTRTED
jgi:hypothetical protein